MKVETSDAPVEAQVLLKIENRAVINGAYSYLVRSADGRFAIGRQVGQQWILQSPWIGLDAAAETAVRVAGGDPKMTKHPDTLRVLATAVLSFFALASAPKPEGDVSPEGKQNSASPPAAGCAEDVSPEDKAKEIAGV